MSRHTNHRRLLQAINVCGLQSLDHCDANANEASSPTETARRARLRKRLAQLAIPALVCLALSSSIAYSQQLSDASAVCNQPAEVASTAHASNSAASTSAIAAGKLLEANGSIAQAESCYRKAFALDPLSPEAPVRLAEVLGLQKETGAAVNYWRLALARNPDNPQISLSLGIALLNDNQNEDAAKVLGDLAQRSAATGLPALNYGSALSRLGKYTDAIAAYQRALQFSDAADPARISLAKVLITLVRYQEAKPLLDAYAPAHPSSPEVHLCLGIVQYKVGSLADAEVELKRAIALHPEENDAEFYLGSVLAEEGKYQEAIVHLQRAVQLDPHKSEIHFQLSRVYQKMKEPELAKAEVTKMRQEEDLSAQDLRAVVLSHDAETESSLGHNEKAAELYRRVIELQPSNPKSQYDLAVIYGLMGNVGDERSILLKAQELQPLFAPVFNQLGVLDMNDGQLTSAEAHFKKSLSIQPGFAPALGNLGVLYGRKGRLPEAERYLRLAVENDPKYATGYVNLGLVLAAEGHMEAALASLNNGLAISPQDAAGQRALALLKSKTATHESQEDPH
jgi:protein O-GlcNAc transferase